MKNLFNKLTAAANTWTAQCRITDLALVKFCLCAVGVMIGISIPKQSKKPVFLAAGAVFLLTWIPLMAKFVPFLVDEMRTEEEKE